MGQTQPSIAALKALRVSAENVCGGNLFHSLIAEEKKERRRERRREGGRQVWIVLLTVRERDFKCRWFLKTKVAFVTADVEIY